MCCSMCQTGTSHIVSCLFELGSFGILYKLLYWFICVQHRLYFPWILYLLLGYEPWNVGCFDLRFVFKTGFFVITQVIELGDLVLSLLLSEPWFALLLNGDAHRPELLYVWNEIWYRWGWGQGRSSNVAFTNRGALGLERSAFKYCLHHMF